jgi:hypothetical protein
MRWHCALALLPLLLYAQEDVLRPRGAPVFEPWTEARTPIRLGLEGGISWNSASQSINYAGVQPTPPTPMDIFKSGSGISPAAAAAVDIGIAPKLGLQFKLGYEQKKWSNSGTNIADCRDLVASFHVSPVRVQSRYTVQANYLAIGAALRYDLTPQLWLTVGPVYHRLLGKVRQTARYELDPNSNCGFLGPDREPLQGSGDRSGERTGRPSSRAPQRWALRRRAGDWLPDSTLPRAGAGAAPLRTAPFLPTQRGCGHKRPVARTHAGSLLPVQWKGLSLYSVLLTVGVWFTIQ